MPGTLDIKQSTQTSWNAIVAKYHNALTVAYSWTLDIRYLLSYSTSSLMQTEESCISYLPFANKHPPAQRLCSTCRSHMPVRPSRGFTKPGTEVILHRLSAFQLRCHHNNRLAARDSIQNIEAQIFRQALERLHSWECIESLTTRS